MLSSATYSYELGEQLFKNGKHYSRVVIHKLRPYPQEEKQGAIECEAKSANEGGEGDADVGNLIQVFGN